MTDGVDQAARRTPGGWCAGSGDTEAGGVYVMPRWSRRRRLSGPVAGRAVDGPGSPRSLLEQRRDERLRVERQQVLRLLPHPDEPDRDAELLLDREHDAALRGRVELGQDDARQADRVVERLRLGEAVLAGGGVEDEEGLDTAPGQPLVDDAADLGQLVHEVRLGVEAAGGVGDHDVGVAGDRRRRARRTRRRPGRRWARGRRSPSPVRCAQIRSWSMAAARKVSAAASTTRRPLARSRAASLPMVVVLPVPLTPTTSTIAGPPSAAGTGSQCSASRGASSPASSARTASSAETSLRLRARSTRSIDERGADVAGDQRLLDLVPVRATATAEGAAQPGAEPGAGLLEALLELLALALPAGGVGLLGGPVGAPGPGHLGRWTAGRPVRGRVPRPATGRLGSIAAPARGRPARAAGLGAAAGPSPGGGSGSGDAARRNRRTGSPVSRPGRRPGPRGPRPAVVGDGLRLVEAQADHAADRVVADGDPVEGVGGLDRAAVVGDDDELRPFGELSQRLREAADVGLVERGIDLVEHAEGRRADLEHREQQRDRGQGPLAAREHRQRLRLLARAAGR